MNASGHNESTSMVEATLAKQSPQRLFCPEVDVSTATEGFPAHRGRRFSAPETSTTTQTCAPGRPSTKAGDRWSARFRQRRSPHHVSHASRPMRVRIAANGFRGTATSANWKMTNWEWRTTAPRS